MKRRQWLIAAVACAAVGLTRAQRPARRVRIGLLWIQSGDDSTFAKAFGEGLAARGYAVGARVEINTDSLVDRYDRLPEAAERLVRHGVDVIVSYGATATLAARKATSTIPIVMITGADPVRIGVVSTLSRPGGNVTGVTFLHPELDGKRLEVLQQAVPAIRRVGLLLNPASATEPLNIPRWQAAADRLQLEIQPIEVRLQSDIDPVIASVAQAKLDALAVVGGTMFVANRTQIVSAITRTGLPAVYGSSDYVDAGGLLSYGPNVSDGFRRAAVQVVKIINGASPADIPFEQATEFELVVNAKAARALGITIPHTIMLRADRVIDER